jgi:hypothetical protein
VDSLNLTGRSIDLPVDVLVEQPAIARASERVSLRGMVAIGAMLSAGLVLTLVLVFTSTQRRWNRNRRKTEKRLMNDPVTQPVPIRQDHSRPSKGRSGSLVEKLLDGGRANGGRKSPTKPPPTKPLSARGGAAAWSSAIWSRASGQSAPARLIALDENEQPITGGAIPLTRQEITFGKDPQRATQVLDSLTVNDLHARLYRSQEGDFFIADQGSIAGTWINYAPVNSSGARLEHGDLIHIGRMMFRFELANPTEAEIKVVDLEQLT